MKLNRISENYNLSYHVHGYVNFRESSGWRRRGGVKTHSLLPNILMISIGKSIEN